MSTLIRLGRFLLLENKITNRTTQSASYSRRSDSKNINSSYKTVKSKVRIEDESGHLSGECNPNWELLSPRGNRFYFPGSIGPAWQGSTTIISTDIPLESLVDYDGKTTQKLLFSVKQCPELIRKNLQEIFPAPEVISPDGLTLITLQYCLDREIEKGARRFVLAAKEICSRLRLNGYWADFMNPFSGKPFYSYASGKNLYKIDERFRGIGMKIETQNDCLVISSDDDNAFSGSVFTNAPSNMNVLKTLIEDS